jgi:Zn-dependent M28 family amino/carboxypeptidase
MIAPERGNVMAYRSGLAVLLVTIVVLTCSVLWITTQPFAGAVVSTPPPADPRRLEAHVRKLSGDLYPRSFDQFSKLDQAAAYISESFRAAGAEVAEQPVQVQETRYRNITARFGASSGPVLVIGAHYDSYGDAVEGAKSKRGFGPETHTPGADDNASGVAALIECARLVATRQPEVGVEFVGFDLEELQTVTGRYRVGSHALARERRSRREAIAGALVLEMVGYRDPTPGAQIVPPFLGIDVPPTGDFLAAVGDTRSKHLLEEFVAGARTRMPELPLVPYRTRLRGWLLPLTRLSDNASFWDQGYPALMLTDTAFLRNPHYHRSTDTGATLDFAFMAQVTEATAGAVARLADAT